ncbi:gliding motility-associated C-terminal domain-containing protein [Chryseobacterium gambrini]|uniref:Gliding motility-associated C-terminal domain-containing protein n=1 Tax=Chryseobacterium gambrini TaxID=373672 RepID=A0AAJ1VMM4_9FLAO|nr:MULTISPECIES: gliding motility-associated C-terminal domain-containing protein [Chryseobacterium]MDN4012859.1 gliding motility-associated C-terminal domain-containing protein [Chryseobacterium gambrini]MDN4030632.1 gliding motility-associated C-terminal domain-containing protein [Chryseobacterium gambrini]QWA36602.1 gliding motility-associated C-terminal domain-containing protein [Chryseobacterium sp. ZHDP1]
MKKFLLIFCSFFYLILNAQLDTEHWFAPMSASSLQGTPECYLYLSTNETTPFSVQIYNNNTVFSTVQVSKNNPVQVTIPNNYMIASTPSNLFTQRSMGLQVKGPKKFFANFRFAVPNQAEIITSKGLAGIGKNFFVGVAPNTTAKPYVNSTIGFIATEDNTTVTLSGYNPNVIFSDGTSSPSRTFTINKGKSYIIEAQSDLSSSNLTGLVGAKITANKPISVTNGNFNSIYTTQNNSNVDILMDQAVPVERLGKTFALVKGNGPADSGMEAALVIATENNTKLTVNGTLLGNVTLNAGQYYIVQGTSYINQGNGHYNMSISANNNVYVYQLLAGTSGSTVYATGGMNFIPPLSCFLPKEINEIGFINKIGSNSFDTKLNIITQTGANVTFNGSAIGAISGPYPVTGNPGWVTYSLQGVNGNITVNSTLPVTAGIAAGNGAVGYGGYFAGFSSVPAITKTGDCYAGILLQVDNNYDSYQWFLNGNPISGATSFSINPELYGAGDYTCLITKNNCETRLTGVYSYTLCPPISTTTYNIGSCNTKVITPAFTNSTQTIVPSLTSIISPPTSGTATVNPTTGQITYTPNPSATNSTDNFIYYVQGNGNPFDFEYFKIIINTNVLQVNNGSLASCAGTNGNGTYNLTSVNVSSDPGTTITYFTNSNLTGQITNPANYSGPAGTVYANVTSQYGCSKTAQITLALNALPNVNNVSLASCTGTGGNGTFNLTAANVSSDPGITVTYFTNSNLTGQITNPATYSGPAGIIYANVTSANGCSKTAQITLTVNSLPNTNNATLTSCAGTNGNGTFNLTSANVSSDPGVTVTYFTNSNLTGQITNPANYSGASGIIYANVTSAAGCSKAAQITLTVNSLPNVTNATLSSCAGANGNGTYNLTTANVSSDPGVTVTYFTNSNLTGQITNPANYSGASGIIYANVTSAAGCSKAAQITLTVNPLLNVTNATLSSCAGTNGNGTFNLTAANVSSDPGITVTYFTNSNLTGQITNPATYSGPSGIIYANVTSANGCSKTAQITLTVNSLPNTNNATLTSCAGNNGNGTFNLTSANVSSDPGVTVTYFTNSNLTGQITNPANYSGASGIIYANVTSAAGCSKTAQITLTVNPLPNVTNATLSSCAVTNGNGTYNLTTANVSSDPGVTVTYFTNSNLTGQIANPANYSGPAGIIYANITSANGCSRQAQITLTSTPSPNINTANYNASLCDDNFDGIVNVNFSTVTPQIVTNAANFTVRYYLSQADANAGNGNTLPVNWTYTANTTVYVRVDSAGGSCPPAFGQINFKIGNKITLLTNVVNMDVCDNDLNGSENVNLNDYKNLFTTNPAITLTFHATLADAQNGTNTIPANQTITSPKTFYVRFVSGTECPNTGIINVTLKSPKKSSQLTDKVVCSTEKVVLDPGAEFSSYTWSTGATTQTILAGAGTYYVDLGFNGCFYRQYVNVTTSQAPTITSINVTASNATINVTGGTPPYQYSLNGIDYQTSNTFMGLSRGIHTVYVLGKDGCLPVVKEFLIVNIINAITPNGDGINDVLNYSDLKIKQNVSIEISDRYGAAVYKSTDKSYIWDGKSGGRPLPTGTYWYILKWIEPDTKLPVSYSGWILIKNRE